MKSWRKSRAPTRFAVTLHAGQNAHRVVVVNVNDGGAGIYGVPVLGEGTAVVLQFLHHRIPAKIAWQDGFTAGVAFDAPINEKMLSTLRRLTGSRAA